MLRLIVLDTLKLFDVRSPFSLGLFLKHDLGTFFKLTLHIVLALRKILQEALIVFKLSHLSDFACKDLLPLRTSIVKVCSGCSSILMIVKLIELLLLTIFSETPLLSIVILLLSLWMELHISGSLVELAAAYLCSAWPTVS